MKTLSALKVANILNGVFCFFCIASTVCFAIFRYFDLSTFFNIGNILIIGWMINPFPLVSLILCLVPFLRERKLPEAAQVMGKKWVWIFIWPVITTAIYLTAAGLTVALTGGV